MTWQYSLFLLIAGILHLISSVSLATSYFVQNIPHFVLPWYMGGVQDEDKKLMINILSFSPLYMLMVVVFSALGEKGVSNLSPFLQAKKEVFTTESFMLTYFYNHGKTCVQLMYLFRCI